MKKLVIFGASGDLAKRKLVPALDKAGASDAEIIAYARSPLEKTFSEELRKFQDYASGLPERIRYIQGDYDDLSSLRDVADDTTIYYFSVPPELYPELLAGVQKLRSSCVVLEKPFGTSYESFQELTGFEGLRIYFVDHYLLKPLIVSAPQILNKDRRLAGLLDGRFVGAIEALFNESIDASGRMYFDKTGCIKDVIQSHLVSCIATMIAPSHCYTPENASEARSEIIEKMSIDCSRCIYGQYSGYADEFPGTSQTETFATLPLAIDTAPWRGVPVIMTGGKALRAKSTEVSFTARRSAVAKFLELLEDRKAAIKGAAGVRLVFEIAPENEIYLDVQAEEGAGRHMLYDAEAVRGIMGRRHGHLRDHEIVFDALFNDTPFDSASAREVSALWRLFEGVINRKPSLVYYEKGAALPEEAAGLIEGIKKGMKD